MADRQFPKAVEDIIATLADICRHQGQADIVELLESAVPRIELTEHDNWNGGTYIFALILDIPVAVFAKVEPKLQEIEKSILSKLEKICRDLSSDHVGSVTITPLTSKSTSVGPRSKPAEVEVEHLWKDGFFRLFLSHVSAHKIAVARLKTELYLRAISAFVAHEDIAPSLVWQNEIELALRSMHALAALLTGDFHQSNWTDQEVGFALGKGVLVVPVRLGFDPYGFIGKVQGLSGSLDRPPGMADLLANTLLNHSATHRQMRKSVVCAFETASSYANARILSKMICRVTDFSGEEKEAIERACGANDQIFDASGVVSRVCSAIGVPIPKRGEETDDIPF
jgi:hypothetical protein